VEVNFIFGQPKQLQLGSSKPGQKLKNNLLKKVQNVAFFNWGTSSFWKQCMWH